MFVQPTTILVGAGASAEFGLPTGVEIFNDAMLEDEKVRAPGSEIEHRFLSSFWNFLRFHNLSAAQGQVRELVARLNESTAYSIDLFSFYNPSHSEIAKLYTVWRLNKELFEVVRRRDRTGDHYSAVDRSYRWRNPRIGDGDAIRNNWLGELANTFLRGAQHVDDLRRNQLTFVTFNYDLIIEESFAHIIRSHERFADTPDDVIPNVIHVHGSFEPASIEALNLSHLTAQAHRIKFISDTIGQQDRSVTTASDTLAESRIVYSIGFAFEELNVELLSGRQWAGSAVALNYDGNTKVENAMIRVGVRRDAIWSGTDSDKLSVGAASSRGFFETLPEGR